MCAASRRIGAGSVANIEYGGRASVVVDCPTRSGHPLQRKAPYSHLSRFCTSRLDCMSLRLTSPDMVTLVRSAAVFLGLRGSGVRMVVQFAEC